MCFADGKIIGAFCSQRLSSRDNLKELRRAGTGSLHCSMWRRLRYLAWLFLACLSSSACLKLIKVGLRQEVPPRLNNEIRLCALVRNYQAYVPAIMLGLERVEHLYPQLFRLFNFTLLSIEVDPTVVTTNEQWLPWSTLAYFKMVEKVHALFGPIDSFAVANVARLSAADFQTPIITPGAAPSALSNKMTYGYG